MRRSVAISLWSAALALVATSALADAPRTLFGRPLTPHEPISAQEAARRKAAFQRHLDENDLVFTGDRVMPRAQAIGLPPDPVADHDGTWHDDPHYATIFLNFFGGMLTSGTNASEMESNCIGAVDVDYPAYAGSEADALAIIQVFENAMAPYAVRVAYEEAPPQHLPYSMVMMGGSPQDVGQDSGTLGVSCSSDCGDVWWRDTTLAFTEQSGNPTTLGNTALQEAAHAFGLDHIDGSEHIMYPLATPGNKIWSSACTPYNNSTGPIGCTYIHRIFCPEGSQNDDAELLAFFGPNAPDVQAPTVVINTPTDGIEVESEGAVQVTAEVSDDHLGYGWRLRVVQPDGGELIANAYQLDTGWDLSFSGLPDGEYEIYVEAVDHDGNEGTDVVSVFVGVPSDDSGGGVDGTGGDGPGDGTGGDGPGATSGGGDGDGDGGGTGADGGASDDDGGKGCATARPPVHPRYGWLWLAFLPAVLRRRPSKGAPVVA
jgi:hypothetical protein